MVWQDDKWTGGGEYLADRQMPSISQSVYPRWNAKIKIWFNGQ